MSDLSRCRAVIVVFAMDGCHHCEEYGPRFQHQVQRFQAANAPLAYYSGGPIAPRTIPIIFIDGASMDPEISALADQHKIEGMPTTLLLRRYGRATKLEGAVSDREIYDLLADACRA